MDKSFIIHLGGINEDYQDDLAKSLEDLLSDIPDFVCSVSAEEVVEDVIKEEVLIVENRYLKRIDNGESMGNLGELTDMTYEDKSTIQVGDMIKLKNYSDYDFIVKDGDQYHLMGLYGEKFVDGDACHGEYIIESCIKYRDLPIGKSDCVSEIVERRSK